jgi:hypothetical protein
MAATNASRQKFVSDSIDLGGATTSPSTGLIASQHENNKAFNEVQMKRMNLVEEYKNQKMVGVSGSPMYAGYFGRIMPIILNGIRIDVPLDGRRYEIPEAFANVFVTRLQSVDADQAMQKKMSDVTNNRESFAGELDLVRLAQ